MELNMEEILYLGIPENKTFEETIQKVVNQCFQTEQIQDSKLIITITLTTPEEIQKLNQTYRGIDKATDVLSFPMFEREELTQKIKEHKWNNEDILGDIIISIEQVKAQAIEYGHSFERELSYMVVHGFYHLMGYDHMTEEEKSEMRKKEDQILTTLGVTREKKADTNE